MIEYPDATKCPNCGRLETTTVCSVCKTDKAEKAVYSYEAQRYIENLLPIVRRAKTKPPLMNDVKDVKEQLQLIHNVTPEQAQAMLDNWRRDHPDIVTAWKTILKGKP